MHKPSTVIIPPSACITPFIWNFLFTGTHLNYRKIFLKFLLGICLKGLKEEYTTCTLTDSPVLVD